MAASIPIAIGFLANQVGLDNLGEKIAEIVAGIRELVDQALDWLMDQTLAAVESLTAMLGVGAEGEEEGEDTGDPEHDAAVNEGIADLRAFLAAVVEQGKASREESESVAARVRAAHPVFTSITVVGEGDTWDFAWAASPGEVVPGAQKEEGTDGPSIVGMQATDVTAEMANAQGYSVPYPAGSPTTIRRLDAGSGQPRLEIADGVIQVAQDTEEKVSLESLMASGTPEPEIQSWLAELAPHLGAILSLNRDRLSADVAGGVIGRGQLNVMKGRVGELLAVPTQESELESQRKRYSDAELVSGVRIARVREEVASAGEHDDEMLSNASSARYNPANANPPVQFFDNMIVRRDGGLVVLAAFEVKSGEPGDVRATAQVHTWTEGRITDGDAIVLDDGERYVYAPSVAGAPFKRVTGFYTAKVILILPKGVSTPGKGSPEDLWRTDRTSLPVTAATIEHLVAKIAAGA
jgi:hypothetical protein